jgi:hypothetical protein
VTAVVRADEGVKHQREREAGCAQGGEAAAGGEVVRFYKRIERVLKGGGPYTILYCAARCSSQNPAHPPPPLFASGAIAVFAHMPYTSSELKMVRFLQLHTTAADHLPFVHDDRNYSKQ